MAGAEFSTFQVIWFIGAGFILGFAASMLWEWLYYRRKRNAQVEAATLAVLPAIRADDQTATPSDASAKPTDESWAMSYRGSGIYLESEQSDARAQPATLPAAAPAPLPLPVDDKFDDEFDEQAEEDAAALPDHLANPRLNPATLATLQAVVAQSPIAHGATHTRVYAVPAQDTIAAKRATSSASEDDTIHGQEVTTDGTPSTVPSALPTDPAEALSPVDTSISQAVPTLLRSHRAADHPDDLALIKGVGEAYKRRLYSAGIYTWRQVAESDIESLRHITRAKPNANIAAWHAQAQELAKKYQRWHTTFRGPLDDLTRIDGIGAITADILYKAGICTYAQLAGTLPNELAKIVPAPTVGDENDFDGWINSAVQLATAQRHTNGAHT